MRLKLGDRLMWEDTEFELIAFDAREARLRSVDGGFTRVALISELIHDPSVDWDRDASTPLAVRTECSSRGLCNRATGTCDCFPGYSGYRCLPVDSATI